MQTPSPGQESFFIFLDKPVGETSQQCLTRFKRRFRYDKIGHHGTLDPFADGLLLAGTNEAAKFFRFLDDSRKTYEATLRFGIRTDTLDHTGKILETKDVPEWDNATLLDALQFLTGKIRQTPPMYSAVKKGGVKLYELARRGEEVEREARDIEIFSLEILQWKNPHLKLRATVSRGTYVRVLAEQIADKLGNVAHLSALRRTVLCGVGLDQAYRIGEETEIPERFKIPVAQLLPHLPSVMLDTEQARDLSHGKPVALKPSQPYSFVEGEPILARKDSHFLGIVRCQNSILHSVRLMDFSKIPSFS